MYSLCANIETPDYISWRSISTLRATVRPLMFASLLADRTCTRGICFVDFNRSGQFVVKPFNNSAIGGGGDGLRSFPIRFLRRIVEWLPYISFGVRKFIYVEKGILPQVASGLQKTSELTVPPET